MNRKLGKTPAYKPVVEEVKPLLQLQEEFLQWRFGLFIHFGMATFHDLQSGGWRKGGIESAHQIAPAELRGHLE